MGLFTPDMNNLRELYKTMLQRSLEQRAADRRGRACRQ